MLPKSQSLVNLGEEKKKAKTKTTQRKGQKEKK